MLVDLLLPVNDFIFYDWDIGFVLQEVRVVREAGEISLVLVIVSCIL